MGGESDASHPDPSPLLQLGYEVLGGYLSPVADGYGKPGLAPGATASHCARGRGRRGRLRRPLAVDGWEASSTAGPVRSLHVLQAVEARLASALKSGGDANADATSSSPPLPTPRAMLLCGEDVLASMAAPGVWVEGHVASILDSHGVVCVRRSTASSSSSSSAPALLAPGGALARTRPASCSSAMAQASQLGCRRQLCVERRPRGAPALARPAPRGGGSQGEAAVCGST